MSFSCRDFSTELVCFNNGTTNKQLIAHYEYAKGSNGSIVLATRYTEADGVTVVDTTGGTVTPGECVKLNADHSNGCIKRTVTSNVLTCNEQVTTYSFTATDLVSFSILSKDGNGNFTATQEHDAGIHAQILALFQSMTVDNTRMEENIGNGAAIFNFWEGNLSNVIDVSPTLIQFDWHLEPSVSDTPDALIEPCIDPIADSVYQNTASQLTTIYNSVPLNTPINNGGQPITFVVTHYTQTSTPNGTTFEYIPAKQVLTYNSAGVPVTDKYYEQWTLNEIPFNPLTDVFSNECGSEVKAIPFQVFCLEKPASTTTEVGLSTTVNAQNSLVGSEQLQFSPYPTSVLPIPTSITVSNDLLNTVPQDAYGVSLSNSSLTVNDLVTKVNFTVTIAQASGDTTDTVQDAIGGGIYDSAGNPIAGTFTVFPAGAVLNGNLGYIALGAGHTVGTAYSFEYTLTNPHAASDLRVFFGFDDLDVGSNQNGIYTINSVYLTYSHVEVTQGERYEVQEIKYSDGTREFRKVSDNSLVTYNSTTDILSYGGCATQTLNTTVSYLEKEVCGTIDGGIQTYELIRVYTRNQNTGLIEISHYEYLNGTIVTGIVNENCDCTCNTICEPALNCNPIIDFSLTQTELDCLLTNGFTLENLCTMTSTDVYTELANLACKDCNTCSQGDEIGGYQIIDGVPSWTLGMSELIYTGSNIDGICPTQDKYDYFYHALKVNGTNDFIAFEPGNSPGTYPINPPIIHPIGTAPYYINGTQLDTTNYTYSSVITYKRKGCPPYVSTFPANIILPRRCDAYNQWINGSSGDKGGNINGYDNLMNNLGLPALVGVPRTLRYLVESININGNVWNGQFIDIPVPTANWQQVLANGINAIVGQTILSYNGIWQVSYNPSWSIFHIVLSEHADDHNSGFTNISSGGWAFRLNAGVMEDNIGVNPDLSGASNWYQLINCVDL